MANTLTGAIPLSNIAVGVSLTGSISGEVILASISSTVYTGVSSKLEAEYTLPSIQLERNIVGTANMNTLLPEYLASSAARMFTLKYPMSTISAIGSIVIVGSVGSSIPLANMSAVCKMNVNGSISVSIPLPAIDTDDNKVIRGAIVLAALLYSMNMSVSRNSLYNLRYERDSLCI